MQEPAPTLSTVDQFATRHHAFSQASLRHLIFQSRQRQSSRGAIPGNGLDKAILRVGRKVLIDERKFFEWLAALNAKGAE
jgi:hypothetical protein